MSDILYYTKQIKSDNLVVRNSNLEGNITANKLQNSTAHYVLKTNGDGNAMEHGLLVKENCEETFVNQNLTTTSNATFA